MSFHALSCSQDIPMGSDNGNHTACAQHQAFACSLLQRICCFILNVSAILINKSILSHTAAHHAPEQVLCLGQRGIGFAIMPVDDLKRELVCQLKVNFLSVQMEHIAPQALRGFNRFPVKDQAEYLIFFEAKKLSLRMLDGIKDSVDTCCECRFQKTPGGFGDGFESFHDRAGMMPQMFKQYIIARQ